MKAKPMRAIASGYEPCEPGEATHVMLCMPGPLPNRILPVITRGERRGTPCWTWNGDTERPTLRPSILTRGGDVDAEIRCHSWVDDGEATFLPDSSHELAGETVALIDIEN